MAPPDLGSLRWALSEIETQQLLMSLADYSLNNPDTLTKYKTAAEISEKVLAAVSKLCVAGEKIVTICDKGDKLIEEEISKVWRGKKVSKGRWLPPAPSVPPVGSREASRA